MKKLFFTAIALVAFSGVSMASTGEVDKSATNDAGRDCMKEAQDARDASYAVSGDWNEATGVGLDVLVDCLEVGNPGKPKSLSIR